MKPKLILDFENDLNILLFDNKENASFDIWTKYNTFELNDRNEVITLDLSELKGKDFSFLDEFRTLTSLDLSSCEIKNLSFIKNLKNIKILNLSNNQVSDLSILINFDKLEELDLTQNLVSDFNYLTKLLNLKTLKFGKNPCLNNSFLKDIKNLINLDISYLSSYNYRPNFNFLKSLPNIEGLTLMFNDLEDVSFLLNSKKLKTLNLVHNKIVDISILSELKFLEKLWLQDNKIIDISSLKFLNQLNYLDLSINNITDIYPLKDLNKLNKLKINNNQISDISDMLKLESLKNVVLKGNKKIEIDFPTSVIEAGWEAIKQFSEKSKESVLFRNVKVLLLGNPNIGKTNLLNYLETNRVTLNNDFTHGVVYKNVYINETNFHIWDFGGQEYFHATHKLFFSPDALNIVIWGKDIPRNDNKVENEFYDLNYWLRTIEQLNSKSLKEEVLLVENKIDLNNPINKETSLNQIDLGKKFPTLNLNYSNMSLLNLNRVDIFKELFFENSNKIISKFNYPQFYEVFWKRIKAINKDFVTVEEINNRDNNENVIAALKVFHNMGILLYFSELIPNKVFIKPQVLLNLLYKQVLSKDKKEKLTKTEISKAILNNSLELNVEDVISLLKHFDLVFEINEEKETYFIPQYLNEINPYITDFENEMFTGCNVKIVADNYLMSLVMLKIFTRFGNLVSGENNKYRFWNNGIIIKKDDSTTMIKFVREKQTIELYQDKLDKNYKLQKEIVDFILDLPEDFSLPKRNLKTQERLREIDLTFEFSNDYFENMNNNTWFPNINPIPLKDEIFTFSKFEPSIYQKLKYKLISNRSINEQYNWGSNYFSVFVSINNEYFVNWKDLNDNIEIGKIKTINSTDLEKIEKVVNFKRFLDIYEEKVKQVDTITEKENNKQVTNNFNGTVNIGNLGDNGKIDEFKVKQNEVKKPNSSNGLTIEEKSALKKWKTKALFGFLFYLGISIILIISYIQESEFIMFKEDWIFLKESDYSQISIIIWSSLGIYLFYKLIYDRYCDPSKENAFIDLYRKKLSQTTF